MTLNLTKEEKEARFKAYDTRYSKMYYNEQKAQNNNRYKETLEKARERYYKKMAELNPEKTVKKYRKRNINVDLAGIDEPNN